MHFIGKILIAGLIMFIVIKFLIFSQENKISDWIKLPVMIFIVISLSFLSLYLFN